jgi:hypothetical protein
MADFGEAALRGGLSFCGVAFANVYYWHLADKAAVPAFVCFWTKADKVEFWPETVCLLITQSGHECASAGCLLLTHSGRSGGRRRDSKQQATLWWK